MLSCTANNTTGNFMTVFGLVVMCRDVIWRHAYDLPNLQASSGWLSVSREGLIRTAQLCIYASAEENFCHIRP